MELSPLQLEALLKHEDAVFGLQELVDVANGLLPDYLPKDAAGRAADDVNPRLVRFYTTEGLIPEPHKEGREARYVYDHLLALLLVRKLLAEGFGSAAIRKALSARQRSELEALLKDEVRVELAPSQAVAQDAAGTAPGASTASAKADFLQKVRARAGLTGAATVQLGQVASPLPARGPLGVETTWHRLLFYDGLELSVRDDFVWPANHVAEEQLIQQLRVALLQLEQARKKRRS